MFLALDLVDQDYDSGSCDGDGGEDVCDGGGDGNGGDGDGDGGGDVDDDDGNGGDGDGDGEWGPQTFFVLTSSLLAPTGFLIYIHMGLLGFTFVYICLICLLTAHCGYILRSRSGRRSCSSTPSNCCR